MNRSTARCIRFALSALALAAAAVQAHDIVIVPGAGGTALLRYGHPHDWQPLEKGKLIELQAFGAGDASPQDRLTALKPQGMSFALPADHAPTGSARLLAARYDNGLWARDPQVGDAKPKAHNTSRLMMPNATSVTNNLKFAKALDGSPADTTLYRRQLGHLLELVPQSNPAALGRGEPLDVLVLFQGKPLAGAGIEVSNLADKVEEDAIKRYVTDASGIAHVTLRERGINMLGVDLERPNDGSLGDAATKLGADKLVMVATYTFVRR